jgi:hypothetical protein
MSWEYRTREQFETPRAPQRTVEYTSSSSKQSSRGWSRRESESYRRSEPIRHGGAQDSENESVARRADSLTIEDVVGSPHPQYGSSGALPDTPFSRPTQVIPLSSNQDPLYDDDDIRLPTLEEVQAAGRMRNPKSSEP